MLTARRRPQPNVMLEEAIQPVCEAGVESASPGDGEAKPGERNPQLVRAHEVGDSLATMHAVIVPFLVDNHCQRLYCFRCRPPRRARLLIYQHSWGCASLHPRLYAAARSASS
ncbi:MAG TPA: hypothetical protein VGJ66_20440, partial [Pyrinomonadaceae bacterium]